MWPFPVAPLAGADVFGQWERTTSGSTSFVVPAGVYSISAVAIGGGSSGRSIDPFDGGAAGGLHWRNEIAVTPGESLSVVVGVGGIYGGSSSGGETYLARGGTYLVRAGGGGLSTTVGQTYAGTLGGGGGNGGPGGAAGGAANGGLGGGTGGYNGNGGAGEQYTTQLAPGGNLPVGGASSGGGRGGTTPGGTNEGLSGWAFQRGEGVGLQGTNGAYGSPIGTQCGAGGFTTNGLPGGLRVMWGGGRTFPANARDL